MNIYGLSFDSSGVVKRLTVYVQINISSFENAVTVKYVITTSASFNNLENYFKNISAL